MDRKFSLLVAFAATLVLTSFNAHSARNFMTEIDYMDEAGTTVGQYVAPCIGPPQMTGIVTSNYTIRQYRCNCPPGTVDC